MTHLVYFPEEWIALNEELQYHPTIQELCTKHIDKDPELQAVKMLAEICAYCSIAIDGTFSQKELKPIVEECIKRLKNMREIVVNLKLGTVVTPDFKSPQEDSTIVLNDPKSETAH